MRNRTRIFSIIVISLISVLNISWTDPEHIKRVGKRFDDGLGMFRAGEFGRAHEVFTSLRMDSYGTPYLAITEYMMALSSYKDSKFSSAQNEFQSFLGDFPEHPAASWARAYLGNCLYKIDDRMGALKQFLICYDIAYGKYPELEKLARISSRRLLWGYLTIDELQIIGAQAEGHSASLVDYIRAKRHFLGGEKARALEICNRSISLRPKDVYTDSIKALSETINKDFANKIRIAILAPTEGRYAEFGSSLINGARLALNQFKDSAKKIEIITASTHGDPLLAAFAAKKTIDEEYPNAIIGPLLSDEAVAVGLVCDKYKIPMITPTASNDGIAALSPYVFQIAATPSLAAKKLAEYAIDTLFITRFSAIAPDDAIGRNAMSYFAEEAKKHGGEIVGVAYYADETVDFSTHIKQLKQPYYDALKRLSARADSTDLRFFKPDGTMRDEDEFIVNIPAIFVPAYLEDLLNILPQITFNYIHTRILGVNGWIIDEIKRMDATYIDSAVAVPDEQWIDKDAPGWDNFERSYKSAYGDKPNRIAALGYDAGKLIGQAIAKNIILPEQIRDYLSGIEGYSGPSGKITFDNYGANTEVRLIMFDRKTPKRLR